MIKCAGHILIDDSKHVVRWVKGAIPLSLMDGVKEKGYHLTGDVVVEIYYNGREGHEILTHLVYAPDDKDNPAIPDFQFACVEYPKQFVIYRAGACYDRVDKETLVINRLWGV